jgi:hypothetical protein
LARHDTAAEPLPTTVLGVIRPHVSPDGTVSVNEIVPAKPFRAVIVIEEVADWPAFTVAGDAVILKPCAGPNENVALAVWLSEPLVPVRIRV